MAEYERANSIICESCEKRFFKHINVFTVANLDRIGSIVDGLLNETLNKVKCPLCKESFTFELPFVAYTLKRGYAILALPSNNESFYISGKYDIYRIFRINLPKFRLVSYQCEVSEKIRIFESGLNDYMIEYIKYKHFDKKYFLDKRESILLFKEITEDSLVFEYRDFLGRVLEILTLSKSVYDNDVVFDEVQLTDKNEIIWQRVDINYFKEKENAKEI